VSFEIINQIRGMQSAHAVRVIILSSLGGEHDIVAALNFGADDFVAKPFSVREVVARVCAVLRCRPQVTQRSTLNCDSLELDAVANRVTAHGKLINLRGIEYRLLEFLMSNPGRTFNRGQLLARVWGGDAAVDERTVDVNVQRLRKILSDSGYEAYIQTVRGFGYRFAPPTPALREVAASAAAPS
jgi:two-component system phosphate regulon response regulator PhoB